MKRLWVPTTSADDWRRLLARPDCHWQPGRSAMALAKCWEAAHPEFPPEILRALETADEPRLARLRILAAVPEYQVDLPGGDRPSQTDVLVIATNEDGLVVIAVEGKVDEEFGPTIENKRKEASPGQMERLDFLHETLGLSQPAPGSTRYQLFHRTASAILVAQQFHASTAVMLVHSFSATSKWFEDFVAFTSLLASPVERNRVIRARTVSKPVLFLGWCTGDRSFATDALMSGG